MIRIPNTSTDIKKLSQQWNLDKMEIGILTKMTKSEKTYEFESAEQLHFEVVLRANFVRAAYALNKAHPVFATGLKTRSNPKYWHLTNNGGFLLKKGVLPSTAIRDIFIHPKSYAFECGTAVVIALYKGILETIPEKKFDELFENLFLWMGNYDKDLFLQSTSGKYSLPGDVRYFKNPDVNPKNIDWQGENAIELGNGSYYGHGIGITSERGIVNHLNTHRIRNAKKSAYLTDYVLHPDFKRLAASVGFVPTT